MLKFIVILVLPLMRARIDICLLKSISTKPHCYEFFINVITRIYLPSKPWGHYPLVIVSKSWSWSSHGYCL